MQLLRKGLIRGVIPFIILIIISLWTMMQGLADASHSFFFYSLIAFFLGLTSVIYQIKQWSFLKQIIAHYFVMLITIFPTLLLFGNYPLNSFEDVLMVYLQFNKAGITLFLLTYFISKLVRKYNNGKSM